MHYHAEVWIPSKDNVEAQVGEAMAPYYEGDHEEGIMDLWDWYQIGGRWKGVHDPTYKQETDPDHIVPCKYCDATGLRKAWGHWENGKKIFNDEWARQCDGCNVCKGTGKELTWPTGWNPHPKDILSVNEILEDLHPHTLILPGRIWETLKDPLKYILEVEGIKDGYLVTVDYHS